MAVRLRNTGTRPGREVVQIYAAVPHSDLPHLPRRLAAFGAVEAEPGQEVTTTVTVPARAFQHWDTSRGAWATEPGTYRLEIGHSSEHLPIGIEVTAPAP